jgi:hypothetical protein
VTEHFNGVSGLPCTIRKNRDYGSFGVIADLVTDRKFGSHGESFRTQALRQVRLK